MERHLVRLIPAIVIFGITLVVAAIFLIVPVAGYFLHHKVLPLYAQYLSYWGW